MSDRLPWVVMPLKPAAQANSRLAPVLSPAEREQLFEAMLLDVLSALQEVARIDGVLAVTSCPLARGHLRRSGARLLDDPEDCAGLNAAVSRAASVLEEQGVPGFLTVPGDVPGVSPHEIDRIAHSIKVFPGLTLVPAADGQGTNCLAMSPPELMPPSFGLRSVEAHTRAAAHLNIEVRMEPLPGFGFDVDRPQDLQQVHRYPRARETTAFLDSIVFDRRQPGRSQNAESHLAVHG